MKRMPVMVAGLGLAVLFIPLCAERLSADDAQLWPTATVQQPSMLDKIGSGTKKVLTQTTDVLTLKKFRSTPKSVPRTSRQNTQQKSWWQRTFGPKESPQPRTLSEWMSLPRSDP